MKKSLFTLFMLLIGLASLTANAETRVLNIKQSFSALYTSAGVKVIYQPTAGGQRTVKITGEASRINEVEVRISGKTLKISPKPNKLGNRSGNRIKGVVVTVIAPMVESIDASSGSSVGCKAAVAANGKKIDLEASSGASISLAGLSCRKLDAETSSGADINIKSVVADKVELDVSSGASINVIKVSAKDTDCEASSGGSIRIAGSSVKGSFSASSGGSIKGSGLMVKESRIDKSVGGSVRINSPK